MGFAENRVHLTKLGDIFLRRGVLKYWSGRKRWKQKRIKSEAFISQ